MLTIRFGHRQDDYLSSALLKSNIPLIHAIVAYSFFSKRESKDELSKAFTDISILTPLEQIYTLAEWVFELRVKANGRGNRENEAVLQKYLEVLYENLEAAISTLKF